MNFLLLTLIATLTFLFSSGSYADLDPASPYLRGRGSSPTLENLNTNSRFKVNSTERRPVTGRSPRSQVQSPEPIPPTPKPIAPEPVAEETVVPTPVAEEPTPVEQVSSQEVPQEQESDENSNLLERLRVLILGVDDDELESLKRRKKKLSDAENSVEVYISPTYFYHDSSSTYTIRNHSSSSPGYTVGLSLWLSPFFGIEGETQSSLGSSITSLSDNSINALQLTKSRIGLSFRSIDIDSPLTPQTLWRISYFDFTSKTSSDTGSRVSTQSNGVQISFEAKLPSSVSYSHRLGVSIEPRLSHKEKSGSQNIKSGKTNTSAAISALVGGEVKFNRKSQIFWSLQHRYERNLFKGQSSQADPETGNTPNGLNVDQGLTLFSIGYRWGG